MARKSAREAAAGKRLANIRSRFRTASRQGGGPRRRRPRIYFGLLGFSVLIGVSIGMVITEPQAAAEAAMLSGQARVVDGDTIDLSGTRVRFWGIDAPESGQVCTDARGLEYACGSVSSRSLTEFIAGRPVDCRERGVDRYGRVIGRCAVSGEDIGAWMVRNGQALDYTRYSRGRYLADELRARSAKAGVWGGVFDKPEEWRRGARRARVELTNARLPAGGSLVLAERPFP